MTRRRKVWMLGAGDLARELYGWIHCDDGDDRYEVVGFIDDNTRIDLKQFHIELPLVSPGEIARQMQEVEFIVGVSSPAGKRSLVQRMIAGGARPVTYIHPTVIVGREVHIGPGTVISPRSVLCSYSTIGEFCTINAFCEIGHEVTVGDYTTLLGHNALNGRVALGQDCLIGSGAIFHPRVKVGERATIGIGSVVLSNVQPGVTVFGNPAKKIPSAEEGGSSRAQGQ